MSELSRREMLGTMGTLAAAGMVLGSGIVLAADEAHADGKKGFSVPPLPYEYNALEPYIDEQTMRIHHDKHHGAYVDNLNKALQGHDDLAKLNIQELLARVGELPEAIRTQVNNNGGGHSNHTIFWGVMAPAGKGGGGEPGGELAKAITSTFGELKTFKEKLNDAAMKRFGSGWAWLVIDKDGKLAIESFANQDSPYTKGLKPLLGVDVWEHAYYLKYQNKRADYLAAWWNVVSWKAIEQRFAKMRKA